MTEIIEQAVRDILTACTPRKVILYAEKRTMATDKLKAFSLCVILPDDADARAVRTHLHLAITVDVRSFARTVPRMPHGSPGKAG